MVQWFLSQHFLCHSPSHASSVLLILNIQTGMVSPQFHCVYDDEFATCSCDATFKSLWQYKAHLQSSFIDSPLPPSVDDTSELPLATHPSPIFLPPSNPAFHHP